VNAIVEAQLADPPSTARLVVAGRTFPTGVLGYWARKLAAGGLLAVLTATSPRRLGHPDGGTKLAGTNSLAVGLQLLVDTLTPDDGFGAVLLVASPLADPVPAFRELAAGARLPGDR